MEDSVSLLCNTTISWIEGTEGTLMEDNKRLNLGKRILDPRGQYLCGKHGSDNDGYVLQVYYRSMCLWDPLV